MQIKEVSAKQIRKLRHITLRQGKPFSTTTYKKDSFLETFHLAAFENNKIVSCATFYPEVTKVFKSKCLVFAQFWPDFKSSTSGWSKTLKRFGEKYSRQIFVKNVALVGKKPVGHVRPTWNFTHK